MFSKALFKQSCKANGVMWAVITFAVCVMLVCVMSISGGKNTSTLITGIYNSIIESTMDSNFEKYAINYYSLTDSALEIFDEAYLATYSSSYAEALSSGEDGATAAATAQANAYAAGVQALNSYISGVISSQGYEEGSTEAQEIQGLIFYVWNPGSSVIGEEMNNQIADFYDSVGEDAPNYATEVMAYYGIETYEEARQTYAREYSAIFLAGNMTSEENTQVILEQLSAFNMTADGFDALTYDVTNDDGETESVPKYTGETGYAYIKDLANSTIVTYQARLDYELGLLDMTAYDLTTEEGLAAYSADVLAIKSSLTSDITGGFLDSLSSDVRDAMTELGQMDMIGLVVGSVFFKMAGLLLPIIYIIMVANNLIAGQVDSGSMAYILSTSTKRRTVVFTQAIFLIGSIFAMCLCTMVTGMICVACIDSALMTLTYADMALLCLGMFLTLFAMSGISFFASCWFNRSKHSMSLGGGLNMFFLVASILGLFGSEILPSIMRMDSLNFFNYCSIITLFDEVSILGGTTAFIWKFVVLAVVGVALYVVGGEKFNRKDLPL